MEIEHFFVCRASAIDKESNSMSLFELVEELQVQAPEFPVIIPLHAVIVFRRGEEEYGRPLEEKFRFSIENPSGGGVLAQELPVKMNEKHFRQRARLNFPLSIDSEGLYKFSLVSSEDSTKSRILPIRLRTLREMKAPEGMTQ